MEIFRDICKAEEVLNPFYAHFNTLYSFLKTIFYNQNLNFTGI
jgi:hypothetical protein